MYYCGIDIAKNKHEAGVIDENGKAMLESISFFNSRERVVENCWNCLNACPSQKRICLSEWKQQDTTG